MELSTEEQAVVATVGEFVDREVRPVARELEHADPLVEQIFGLAVPRAVG